MHPGAWALTRTHRVLTVLLVLVLVAALDMSVPAHGELARPSATGDSASSPAPRAGSAQGRWVWPLAAPHTIIGPYAAPAHDYGPGHRGVDIRASGSEVRAVEDGTVRFAGSVAGRGVVSILHADGLASTYEPVTASVSAGDHVSAGQSIGALEPGGDAGHCQEACLHLGARRGGAEYQDPEPLLRGAEPSVLLPLGSVAAMLTGLEGAPT